MANVGWILNPPSHRGVIPRSTQFRRTPKPHKFRRNTRSTQFRRTVTRRSTQFRCTSNTTQARLDVTRHNTQFDVHPIPWTHKSDVTRRCTQFRCTEQFPWVRLRTHITEGIVYYVHCCHEEASKVKVTRCLYTRNIKKIWWIIKILCKFNRLICRRNPS